MTNFYKSYGVPIIGALIIIILTCVSCTKLEGVDVNIKYLNGKKTEFKTVGIIVMNSRELRLVDTETKQFMYQVDMSEVIEVTIKNTKIKLTK